MLWVEFKSAKEIYQWPNSENCKCDFFWEQDLCWYYQVKMRSLVWDLNKYEALIRRVKIGCKHIQKEHHWKHWGRRSTGEDRGRLERCYHKPKNAWDY